MNSAATRLWVLKLSLAVLAAYHLGVGVMTVVFPEASVAFGKRAYGLEVEFTPQYLYMLKALGMYALFTGTLCAVALRDPLRHRSIVLAAVLLLAMRATTRLVFFDVAHDAFGVTWGRNLLNVGIMTLQASSLWWGVGGLGEPAQRPAPALPPGLLGSRV
ncbi:MAG: hypothetical protein KDD82_13880 [Planctomycetes bacterium]|nr:hypothetical protein [Planctomycetota bacterium]